MLLPLKELTDIGRHLEGDYHDKRDNRNSRRKGQI